MRRYRFDLLHNEITDFVEIDHIIRAHSLEDAVQKFTRKHEIEAPAYWDEPAFDTTMELTFKRGHEAVRYRISW